MTVYRESFVVRTLATLLLASTLLGGCVKQAGHGDSWRFDKPETLSDKVSTDRPAASAVPADSLADSLTEPSVSAELSSEETSAAAQAAIPAVPAQSAAPTADATVAQNEPVRDVAGLKLPQRGPRPDPLSQPSSWTGSETDSQAGSERVAASTYAEEPASDRSAAPTIAASRNKAAAPASIFNQPLSLPQLPAVQPSHVSSSRSWQFEIPAAPAGEAAPPHPDGLERFMPIEPTPVATEPAAAPAAAVTPSQRSDIPVSNVSSEPFDELDSSAGLEFPQRSPRPDPLSQLPLKPAPATHGLFPKRPASLGYQRTILDQTAVAASTID
ncbi:MAG: hypothetical protein F6J97_08675 [Leptolyngbya sp. SIO4C1]|nr:hypothetical protein [Leptolyngbya sp. SIO4C1]